MTTAKLFFFIVIVIFGMAVLSFVGLVLPPTSIIAPLTKFVFSLK